MAVEPGDGARRKHRMRGMRGLRPATLRLMGRRGDCCTGRRYQLLPQEAFCGIQKQPAAAPGLPLAPVHSRVASDDRGQGKRPGETAQLLILFTRCDLVEPPSRST